MGTALIAVCFCFVYLVWMMDRMLDCLFVETEKLVNNSEFLIEIETFFYRSVLFTKWISSILGLMYSKSKAIYKRFNCITEAVTKFINSFPVIILYPTAMISSLTVNLYDYFINDLGADAFRLPFPYWYARLCEPFVYVFSTR